jgi:hypothetical protein
MSSPADLWLLAGARMVIASIIGFVVSAQFVSLKGLEVPYYVVLTGCGVLKLASRTWFESSGSPTHLIACVGHPEGRGLASAAAGPV